MANTIGTFWEKGKFSVDGPTCILSGGILPPPILVKVQGEGGGRCTKKWHVRWVGWCFLVQVAEK